MEIGDVTSKPYISIVTAAYNAERTVGDTLDSVKAAKTARSEYIFIDGNSHDRTLKIAQGYSDTIDLLISEPDDGQYHAISKGLTLAQGEVQGWINADDKIFPWTLTTVERIFREFPQVSWITGLPSFLDREGNLVKTYTKPAAYPRRLISSGQFDRTRGGFLQQESMFWRRSLYDLANGIDLRFSLAADFDLWTRFAEHAALIPVDVPLAAFRELPGEQRSSKGALIYDQEVAEIQAAKRNIGRAWGALARRGRRLAALSRLAIHGSGPLITYDRTSQKWTMVERKRNISRHHISELIDMAICQR